MTKKNETSVYFIADLHIPYHDKEAVAITLHNIMKEKPNVIVLGGDIVDLYSVSHFRKDPSKQCKLQSELNDYNDFMKELRSVHKGKLVYLIGNHERRIQKYLMENTELYGLDSLSLEHILSKDKYKFDLKYQWEYNGMIFTHGINVGKYCADKELDKFGVNGISGHKHNHNVSSKTNNHGSFIWISAPCLCDFAQQEYVHNPNWQLGYVELRFNELALDSYKVKLL